MSSMIAHLHRGPSVARPPLSPQARADGLAALSYFGGRAYIEYVAPVPVINANRLDLITHRMTQLNDTGDRADWHGRLGVRFHSTSGQRPRIYCPRNWDQRRGMLMMYGSKNDSLAPPGLNNPWLGMWNNDAGNFEWFCFDVNNDDSPKTTDWRLAINGNDMNFFGVADPWGAQADFTSTLIAVTWDSVAGNAFMYVKLDDEPLNQTAADSVPSLTQSDFPTGTDEFSVTGGGNPIRWTMMWYAMSTRYWPQFMIEKYVRDPWRWWDSRYVG